MKIHHQILLVGGSVLAVIVVVVAFVLIKAAQNPPGPARPGSASAASSTGTALPASVLTDIATVPQATLNAVGAGTTYSGSVISVPGPPAATGGKPEVLYIGAEYCPYCAAERWAMAVALSRFGTFSGLHGIHSAGGAELYPDTPTLTFYKSTYTSTYLTFAPVEETTVSRATLQNPTKQQQALFKKYDGPRYVGGEAGAIPFIDIGNKYLLVGAQYSLQALAGNTWSQVVAALHDTSSAIARGADGAANILTAAICKLTSSQPANVCGSPAIRGLQGHL